MVHLVQKTARVRQFVNHGEGEREIDGAGKIVQAHAFGLYVTCFNAVMESGFAGATLQHGEHFGLHVHRKYFAPRTDEPG
jgi:hypothetical protein